MCMEFQINNAVLNEALKVLNKVIPLRSTLPVLSTVLFTSGPSGIVYKYIIIIYL